MPLRTLLIVALTVLLAIAGLYATTVRRGDWGMREELAWEAAASGELPVRTRIFAEQRLPEYPPALRCLAPVFADMHAIDVRLRWSYWHEEVFPDVDEAPSFELIK